MSSISNGPPPVHDDVYKAIYKFFHSKTEPDYTDTSSLKAAQKVHAFIIAMINTLGDPSREDHNSLRKKYSILDYFSETIDNTPLSMKRWMLWVTDEALHYHLKVQYEIKYVRRPKKGFTEGFIIKVTKILTKNEESKENTGKGQTT